MKLILQVVVALTSLGLATGPALGQEWTTASAKDFLQHAFIRMSGTQGVTIDRVEFDGCLMQIFSHDVPNSSEIRAGTYPEGARVEETLSIDFATVREVRLQGSNARFVAVYGPMRGTRGARSFGGNWIPFQTGNEATDERAVSAFEVLKASCNPSAATGS